MFSYTEPCVRTSVIPDVEVTGLHAGAKFTVSPSTLASKAGAQTVALSVTTAPVATQSSVESRRTNHLAWVLLLLPLVGARRLRRSSRRIGRLMAIALFLFVGGWPDGDDGFPKIEVAYWKKPASFHAAKNASTLVKP